MHNPRPTVRSPRIERLEDRRVLAATEIEVLAAGLSGTEDATLEVAGVQVARWDNVAGNFANRQFVTLRYTHPTTVTADDVVVRLVDSAGAGKDLRVDGVRIAGVKYESESPNTWNTGAYDTSLQEIVPSYALTEVIYANGGRLHYSTGTTSRIVVRAAGATNTESMRLLIDGVAVQTWTNIGGNYRAGTFASYTYNHPTKVTPDRVRVDYFNDGRTPAGADRNLRVDALIIDSRRYESESPVTFSTGTWVAGTVTPGFPAADTLEANGYFQYTAVPAGGSRVVAWVAGAAGDEAFRVVGDGGAIATRVAAGGDYNSRRFVAFPAVHPRVLSLDDLRVEFTNDGVAANGTNRNLRVDALVLDGVRHEAEALTTFSTGTWRPGLGIQPGFVQDERLQGNGALEFGQDPAAAGTLGLGSTQYEVNEAAGFIDVTFARTGGARGAVTIDYTTVNGTAVAGQDFAATGGTLVIRDGATAGTVRVPITNDTAREGAEAFNVSADRVTGGASLGQPRTTTVTIRDDDAPNIGTGIGLLGEYYLGRDFATRVLERTDPTVAFDWGTGAPAPGVPADDFSVRWTGEVEALYTETYTFEVTADDGVRLWVNGQQLVDAWRDQSSTTYTGTIALQAGVKADLRMEMYDRGGSAVAQLRWSSPRQSKEIVPTTQLYSEPVVVQDGQFTAETVIGSGLQNPTAIEFARVGGAEYLYIAQQDGRVRLAINGVLQAANVVDYRTSVNFVRDRGLLGFTVHPDLAENPYIYLLYTYDPPETQGQSGLAAPDNFGNRGSRLTRLTLDAANGYRTVVPGSDVVLLGKNSTWANLSSPDKDSTDDLTLRPSGLLPNGEWVEDILVSDSQSHTVGSLDFGPDGSLYVTNGDGTSYGRVDPRTTRVQDLDSLSGKMLRINPLTGEGYADNPFYTGDVTDDRSKVFNYGLRNPFRIAVDPRNGTPFVGDVGWNAWEEINGGRGENFGWPFFEGGAGSGSQGGDAINRPTGGYRDLPEAQAFYAAGGDSVAQPPLWSRAHSAGGVALVLGDFYTGSLYPTQFRDALFFTDFGDPTVRALRVDTSGVLLDSSVVMGSVGQVIEMTMGLDGRIYYVDLTGKIGRINYTPAAAGPVSAVSEPLFAARSVAFGEEPKSASKVAASAPSVPAAAYDAALELLLAEPTKARGKQPSAEATRAAEPKPAAEPVAALTKAFSAGSNRARQRR